MGRAKRRVHEGRSGRATPYGRRVATIRVSPPARRFLISRRAMLVHDHPNLAVVNVIGTLLSIAGRFSFYGVRIRWAESACDREVVRKSFTGCHPEDNVSWSSRNILAGKCHPIIDNAGLIMNNYPLTERWSVDRQSPFLLVE